MSSQAQAHPPLLRLPLEIRREIYAYLLMPADTRPRPDRTTSPSTEYETDPRPSSKTSLPTLHFRHAPPAPTTARCTTYKIRSGRLRSALADATYECINRPPLHTSILLLNRQVYAEAADTLYGGYTFDFDTHIEACLPFLQDRTPSSRGCIKSLGVVKRALPYEKDFDRCEWASMCAYLASDMALSRLHVGVAAGRPATGWDGVRRLGPGDFDVLARFDEMRWVEDLARIEGLARVEVRARVEHCPPVVSASMGFFVEVSASVEGGLGPYLQRRMVGGVA